VAGFLQHFQHPPGQAQTPFHGLVGVRVGAQGQGAAAVARLGQGLGKQGRGLRLVADHGLEIQTGGEPQPGVAGPGIAVDAAVLAAPVGVEGLVKGQIGRVVVAQDAAAVIFHQPGKGGVGVVRFLGGCPFPLGHPGLRYCRRRPPVTGSEAGGVPQPAAERGLGGPGRSRGRGGRRLPAVVFPHPGPSYMAAVRIADGAPSFEYRRGQSRIRRLFVPGGRRWGTAEGGGRHGRKTAKPKEKKGEKGRNPGQTRTKV